MNLILPHSSESAPENCEVHLRRVAAFDRGAVVWRGHRVGRGAKGRGQGEVAGLAPPPRRAEEVSPAERLQSRRRETGQEDDKSPHSSPRTSGRAAGVDAHDEQFAARNRKSCDELWRGELGDGRGGARCSPAGSRAARVPTGYGCERAPRRAAEWRLVCPKRGGEW